MSSPAPPIRVVLDTNVILRALANASSPSGQVIRACEERKAIILLSKPLVDEYRRVLAHLVKQDESITHYHIEAVLRRLSYVGEYTRRIRASFPYPRDPTDSKLIELAIDGRATHIISHDHDLLSLPKSRGEAGRRFRQQLRGVTVILPNVLLRQHPQLK